MCLGSQLSGDPTNKKVYLMRNIQGSAAQLSGYEVWDVTNVSNPGTVPVSAVRGLRSTHKLWWECNTGIAYMPGSKAAPAPLWRQSQAMLIYDWHIPTAPPVYIRTFGLPGGQPCKTLPAVPCTDPIPNSLHGAISAHEHPNAAGALARAATPNDVIGNRIYAAWGVGDDGIMTIIDRKKLLPPSLGGTWILGPGTLPGTTNADAPSEAELYGVTSPTVGYFTMSPDQGGHTSMPIFGLKPPSYGNYTEFKTRDVVVLTSEATANKCDEAPHWAFAVDVTVENSITSPPGTRPEHDIYQGPMVLSTMSLDPRVGEKYPRGNYCTRGARFGLHSSEENFRNPLYGKLTALAWFTGGVRVWDIREPQAPVEVAFYVPVSNANTSPDGYMTNNVEVDNRGFIYVVDRNGAGLDILELTGCAKQIVDKGHICQPNDQGDNGD
jgi:hypothetical protein